MLILPAIDLKDGKCVRLYQGQMNQATVFSEKPAAVAQKWESMGAKFLHLVDLDGAFAGKPQNLAVVKEIIRTINIPVELGGGIRDLNTIKSLLEEGVNRVILGTSAVTNPQLVEEACALYDERIVLGLDAKNGLVSTNGWEKESTKTYLELAADMKKLGIKRVIFTDTLLDGTLQGPNLASTQELAAKTGLRVIASGGFSSLADLEALKKIEGFGIEGAILGKALYAGSITLPEALAIFEEGEHKC
ncbi:1-(5-phosphoribosyl)-5-[(5-phosphoribosylamino)methylideneamino]imidazole-4-carboxamide isomerase [Bacillota bacterium LX-D]|nr:1-(5-phosphoribosyl)-5-[(5-phosphoribosylamino)methylideneamino]imidazole-4-carboxamide isomerase [Bacillota bacterium LX-D]